MLDTNAAVDYNAYAAKGIDSSMLKVDDKITSVPKQILIGYRTDAGSGSTWEDLAVELNKHNRNCLLDQYLSATCTMHGMTMQSPCEKFFDNWAISNRNLIHILFAC